MACWVLAQRQGPAATGRYLGALKNLTFPQITWLSGCLKAWKGSQHVLGKAAALGQSGEGRVRVQSCPGVSPQPLWCHRVTPTAEAGVVPHVC